MELEQLDIQMQKRSLNTILTPVINVQEEMVSSAQHIKLLRSQKQLGALDLDNCGMMVTLSRTQSRLNDKLTF